MPLDTKPDEVNTACPDVLNNSIFAFALTLLESLTNNWNRPVDGFGYNWIALPSPMVAFVLVDWACRAETNSADGSVSNLLAPEYSVQVVPHLARICHM